MTEKQITELSIFVGQNIQASVLDGGLANTVVKVTTPEIEYVAKKISSEQLLLKEANIQQLAAKIGIAPHVIAKEHEWLVSEFVDGNLLVNSDLKLEQKLMVLVSLAASLHQLPSNTSGCNKLNLVKVLESLTERANIELSVYRHFQPLVDKAVEISIESLMTHESLVLIHGDLNFTNVIVNPNRQCLIDYETASLATIEYELGMMFAVNSLSLSNLDLVTSLYHKLAHKSSYICQRKVTRYALCAAIINALWYLEQYSTEEKHIYQQKAVEQFKYAQIIAKKLLK